MSGENLIDLDVPDENILTESDVTEVIKKIYGNLFEKLIDYNLNDYSKDKIGFVANHGLLNVTIKLTNEKDVKKLNFFVKSKPLVHTEVAEFININDVLEEESMFYSTILPELMKDSQIDKFSPTCYLIKSDLLVMEDLKNQNFVMGDRPINPLHFKTALSALARFHASSILLENRLGKTLNKVFPKSFKERVFNDKESKWFMFSVDNTLTLAQKFGLKNWEKCSIIMEKIFDILKPSDSHRNVICHGDLWANNLMFDDKDNCILIDFQILRYAPMVNDILHLLYVNAESNYRKESENELLKHYYSVLNETITKNSPNAKVPTFNELIEAYNDLRIFGKILSMLYLPGLHIDPELLKDSLNDLEAFKKVMLDSVENNERYRSILKSAVEDLLDMTEEK